MKIRIDWRKKAWWFAKNFPAVLYGVIFAMIFILVEFATYFDVEPNILTSLILSPFIPIFLIFGGLAKIINETLCILLILCTLISLDLITFLLRKFFTAICGYNFYTKAIVLILTITTWLLVFLVTVGKLPIDT